MKTKWLAALCAAALALAATGCDDGFTEAALTAMKNNAAQGTNPDDPVDPSEWRIEDGVLREYLGDKTDVTIPKGVREIGSEAFYNNKTLESVTIPDSVTSIGNYAFYGCSGLTEVVIPDGVTSIGYDAFDGCDRLETVTYGGNLAQWCAVDGLSDLMRYADSVTMKDGTDLKSMTALVIPDGVTSIGDDAFYGCTSLTGVTIPEGVTSIGYGAFSGCTSLTDVTIPDSVTSIGDFAFRGCTSLTGVKIPDGVTSIGYDAFSECNGLETVTYGGDLAQWCAVDGLSDLMRYADSVTMKDGTDLKSMTALVIPDGVTSIGSGAFYRCSSLTEVIIPDSVESLGTSNDWYGVFESCTSLTDVTIGEGVTSIGDYAFSGCRNLENVHYNGTEEEWKDNITISSNSGLSGKTITGKDGTTWTAQ